MAHSSFRDAGGAAGDAGHVVVATVGNNGRDIDANSICPFGCDLGCVITVPDGANALSTKLADQILTSIDFQDQGLGWIILDNYQVTSQFVRIVKVR